MPISSTAQRADRRQRHRLSADHVRLHVLDHHHRTESFTVTDRAQRHHRDASAISSTRSTRRRSWAMASPIRSSSIARSRMAPASSTSDCDGTAEVAPPFRCPVLRTRGHLHRRRDLHRRRQCRFRRHDILSDVRHAAAVHARAARPTRSGTMRRRDPGRSGEDLPRQHHRSPEPEPVHVRHPDALLRAPGRRCRLRRHQLLRASRTTSSPTPTPG